MRQDRRVKLYRELRAPGLAWADRCFPADRRTTTLAAVSRPLPASLLTESIIGGGRRGYGSVGEVYGVVLRTKDYASFNLLRPCGSPRTCNSASVKWDSEIWQPAQVNTCIFRFPLGIVRMYDIV